MKRLAVTALLFLLGVAIAWVFLRAVVTPDFPNITDAPALTTFGPYRPDMNLRQAFESLPPAGGERTGLTLLEENRQAWAARWRMLADARESIDVSYFILREDVFGAAFLGHLLHKAKAGVRVRVLFDSQGTVLSFTSRLGNDWIDTLSNAPNVEVKMFRPLRSRYLEALATLNPAAAVGSEHDKILVCDGTRSMIGGRNIAAEYFAHPRDREKTFEDVDVILDGRDVARGLTAAFESQYRSDWAHKIKPERVDLASYDEELSLAYRAMDAWIKEYKPDADTARRIAARKLSWSEDLARLPRSRGTFAYARTAETSAETRLLDSHARSSPQTDAIAQGLRRLVQSAREHILVQSPYLVLSEEAVNVLEQAGRRGVAITIFTNSPVSSDNAMSQAFFLEQWPRLLARVPRMRLFVTGNLRTLHSKVIVFDDRTVLIGTYNLDPVSMGMNSEIMAAVWSDDFARRAAATVRTRLRRGAPLVYEYRIKRDARGRPVRDRDGHPIVAFGPQDHAPPEQWRKVQAYWILLRAAEKIPGFSPLF